MKPIIIRLFSCLLAFLLLLTCAGCKGEKKEKKETVEETETETMPLTENQETDQEETFSLTPLMQGIDVSKWQGDIDWAKVKEEGVEFAMIRLGHSDGQGNCTLDPKFSQNANGATAQGVLVGVYFYSQAKTEEDAKTEAQYVLDHISGLAVSFPVVMDYEWTTTLSALTPKERGDIALAFLSVIKSAGYDPMLYVPTEELLDETLWEKERMFSSVFMWGACYDEPSYPEILHPDGISPYAMWQYSNTGKVAGIVGNVDRNLAYFQREKIAVPEPETTTPPVTTKREFNQMFTSCNKKVTAKVEVNLRSIPSIDGEMLGTLKNGEYVLCTGESDMGWSRLEWNGKRVFAVTTYLVDEKGESTVPQQNFTVVEEQVTAKDTVNLRLTPGTEGQVVGELKNGEYLVRTGIGDKGWSRLIFNGQTVYAVTSYLQVK